MSTTLRHEHFGPYKLIRPLGDAHGASRFVVLCNRTDTNYLLYRFEYMGNQNLRRRTFESLIKMSTLDHAHLLKIDSVSYDDQGRLCVVTPYTGNHDGLVTIDDLLQIRDGSLGVVESIRAIEHLLDACNYAHKAQVVNGTLASSDILVDRYGCLQVQFYGLHSLKVTPNENQNIAHLVADEIRSVVDLGYTLMTGLSTGGDRIAPSRVVKKLDRAWDTWFDIGLDPLDGFESMEHALNAMPTNPNCAEWLTTKSPRTPQVHIGSMLRRFRSTSPHGSTRNPRR